MELLQIHIGTARSRNLDENNRMLERSIPYQTQRQTFVGGQGGRHVPMLTNTQALDLEQQHRRLQRRGILLEDLTQKGA